MQAAPDELTAENFLGALSYLAKSKKDFNPEEVADTLQQALPLLPQLTPEQLVQCLKDIAAADIQPSAEFLMSALTLLQQRLTEVGLVGLGHLSWAVASLMYCLDMADTDGVRRPVTDADNAVPAATAAAAAVHEGGMAPAVTGNGGEIQQQQEQQGVEAATAQRGGRGETEDATMLALGGETAVHQQQQHGDAWQQQHQESWQGQLQLEQQLQLLLPPLWVEDLLAATLQLMREQQHSNSTQQQLPLQQQQQQQPQQQQQQQRQGQRRSSRLPFQPLVHLLLLPATLDLVPSPVWCMSYFQLLEAGFRRASCQDVAQLVECLTRWV